MSCSTHGRKKGKHVDLKLIFSTAAKKNYIHHLVDMSNHKVQLQKLKLCSFQIKCNYALLAMFAYRELKRPNNDEQQNGKL